MYFRNWKLNYTVQCVFIQCGNYGFAGLAPACFFRRTYSGSISFSRNESRAWHTKFQHSNIWWALLKFVQFSKLKEKHVCTSKFKFLLLKFYLRSTWYIWKYFLFLHFYEQVLISKLNLNKHAKMCLELKTMASKWLRQTDYHNASLGNVWHVNGVYHYSHLTGGKQQHWRQLTGSSYPLEEKNGWFKPTAWVYQEKERWENFI